MNRHGYSNHRREQRHRIAHDRKLGMSITFYDEEGNIRIDLLDQQAEKAARIISENKNSNKSTQLRRFYDELVMWEEKTRTAPAQFRTLMPFVRMLKAKAAYAMGRKLVDGAFTDMLNQVIDQIRNPEDMTTAKLFFEAFLGYYKLAKGD